MKNLKFFLPSVLLSLVMVFALMASELTTFAKQSVMRESTYTDLISKEDLTKRVRGSLETYFKEQYSTTAIPAETYMDALPDALLEEGIRDSIDNAFAYLNGDADSMEVSMDFTQLETAISDVFSVYADENGYAKDEAYEKKLNSTIDGAKARILSTVDVFKFSTLESSGLLTKARRYVLYLTKAMVASLILTAVLLGALIVLHRRQPVAILYWIGTPLLVSSVLMMIPLVYVKATNYFAGFAIKSDQIYAAVTGSLNALTNRLLTVELICFAGSVLLLTAFAALRKICVGRPNT